MTKMPPVAATWPALAIGLAALASSPESSAEQALDARARQVAASTLGGATSAAGAVEAPGAGAHPKQSGVNGDPLRWDAPDVAQQLEADKTELAAGAGALFVPRMSDKADEPALLIKSQRREVAVGRTGKRIVLDAGRYSVIVGSGELERLGTTAYVEVEPGKTTVVPVTWGALRVDVLDRELLPHRGGYEIYRIADGQSFGLGFGADTFQGEAPRVWLLPPGAYRIVLAGAAPTDAVNVASAQVTAAGMTRFRLVMDRGVGTFAGASVVRPGEMAEIRQPGPWQPQLIVGVEGAINHANNFVGLADQLIMQGGGFALAQLRYAPANHLLSLTAEAELGVVFIDPARGDALPLLKGRDRARAEALYSYLLADWVGPYLRGVATTQLLKSHALFSEPTTIALTRVDGSSAETSVGANGRYRVSRAFGPTIAQGGGGLAFRLLNRYGLAVNLRGGVAYRYNRYRDTRVEDDDPATAAVEYRELDTFDQTGIEATLDVTARLTSWLSYNSTVEAFGDFDDLRDPLIEWRNVLAFSISRYLSLNYTLALMRQPQIIDALQVQQAIALRANFDVF